ncbi:hypothetical protein FQN54_009780 [Arachnomyces sp. PD_36]|nr:hypothetical protein FQN54_009780 [Arachnomyces sp. PD_36]
MTLPFDDRSHAFSPPAPAPAPSATMTSPITDLPQSQVDAIIRTKRKAREPKACYPCHTRKVKCDRNLPCDGCVKRDHADLCSYERPSKKRQVESAAPNYPEATYAAAPRTSADTSPNVNVSPGGIQGNTATVSIPRDQWENVCSKLKEMEETVSALRTGLGQVEGRDSLSTSAGKGPNPTVNSDNISSEGEGIHAANNLGDGTVHLGSRSVLAYILGKSGTSQETTQALLEGGILPKLGLDNASMTYPFVDLWSSETSTFDITAVCNALPDDAQCREFLYYYRDIGATIYPVLEDISKFEAQLNALLRNRSIAGGPSINDQDPTERPFGMSIAFMGLLFAVLASGCQSSHLASRERELTSQVYTIQTLLIIGNVLAYNMNPGTAYILLGMSLRMGLSLGLHVESNHFSTHQKYLRRRVWWSMAWQDCHFSLSYDRPSTTAFCQPDIPYRADSEPGDRSYFETLCRIISLTLEVVRGRMLSPHSQISFAKVQTYKEEIQRIFEDATPHLRDRTHCRTSMDHLERLALKLHSSYITSELCRPALKTTADLKDESTKIMRKDCINGLLRTVEAYVELNSISSHGARSWIGLQRAISCAFLLAIIEESKSDPRVWNLLRQLEAIIAERASAEGVFSQPRPETTTVTNPTVTTTTTTAPSLSAGVMIPPQNPYEDIKPDISSTGIQGMTNIPVSSYDPVSVATTTTIPTSITADTETQWAKPLAKSLRALQKLNAALSAQAGNQKSTNTTGLAPAHTAVGGVGTFPASAANTPARGGSASSLPPPTPESSTSGEWNLPSLLDKAAEYIHPPLWG